MLSSPKIFRGGDSYDTGDSVCGTPGLNGTQSRVRTSRPCFSHDKSTRHSGALQMTSAPAYNWYVSNQYLDTRDTVTPGMFAFGWHRRHRRRAARPGWSRSFLVRCNAAAALITTRASFLPSRIRTHPHSGHPFAQLCLPMRLPLTRWHSEQTPLVGESCSYEHSASTVMNLIIRFVMIMFL